jgi:hypothetical protein
MRLGMSRHPSWSAVASSPARGRCGKPLEGLGRAHRLAPGSAAGLRAPASSPMGAGMIEAAEQTAMRSLECRPRADDPGAGEGPRALGHGAVGAGTLACLHTAAPAPSAPAQESLRGDRRAEAVFAASSAPRVFSGVQPLSWRSFPRRRSLPGTETAGEAGALPPGLAPVFRGLGLSARAAPPCASLR